VIDEVRYKAKQRGEHGKHAPIPVFKTDVAKSDYAVPVSLKEALRAAVSVLENVAEAEKDYHPGTNEQVLVLVHCSLFPLVFGLSRVMVDGPLSVSQGIALAGKGEVIDRRPHEGQLEDALRSRILSTPADDVYSDRIQWLPCDVALSFHDADSEDIQRDTKSYINNLCPQDYSDLYQTIEKIIAHAISLWNITLGYLRNRRLYPQGLYRRIKYEKVEWEVTTGEQAGVKYERPVEGSRLVFPHGEQFAPPPEPKTSVDLCRDFGNIQVIVKLANIQLTPEKPSYPGGSWHVEGQMVSNRSSHIVIPLLFPNPLLERTHLQHSAIVSRKYELTFNIGH
jgi:hypothetical protein